MTFRLTLLASVIMLSAELALATEKTTESAGTITAPIKTAPIINKKQSLGIPHQSGNEVTSSEATPVTETEADLERRRQARRDADAAQRSRAERKAQARVEDGEQARDQAERQDKTRAKDQVQEAIDKAQQGVETQRSK